MYRNTKSYKTIKIFYKQFNKTYIFITAFILENVTMNLGTFTLHLRIEKRVETCSKYDRKARYANEARAHSQTITIYNLSFRAKHLLRLLGCYLQSLTPPTSGVNADIQLALLARYDLPLLIRIDNVAPNLSSI